MIHFEGNVLHVYFDQAGKRTIGKGHLCSEHELATGQFPGGVQAVRDDQGRWSITGEQSTIIFRFDVHRFVVDLRNLYKGPRPLKPHEADAILLWDFNTGGLIGSGVLLALNEGRFEDVPGQMMRWNHIRDRHTGQLVVCDDLTERRKAEISIFVNGYGHPETNDQIRLAAEETALRLEAAKAYALNFGPLELRDDTIAGDGEPTA